MNEDKNRLNKEQLAIALAYTAARGSEDPYQKVGAACLRQDGSLLGVGYNGAPPNINIDWSNRDERRKRAVHAELNALAYTEPGEAYLLSVTMCPCLNCLATAARYGVKKVLYCEPYSSPSYGSIEETHKIASEYGITIQQVPKV